MLKKDAMKVCHTFHPDGINRIYFSQGRGVTFDGNFNVIHGKPHEPPPN